MFPGLKSPCTSVITCRDGLVGAQPPEHDLELRERLELLTAQLVLPLVDRGTRRAGSRRRFAEHRTEPGATPVDGVDRDQQLERPASERDPHGQWPLAVDHEPVAVARDAVHDDGRPFQEPTVGVEEAGARRGHRARLERASTANSSRRSVTSTLPTGSRRMISSAVSVRSPVCQTASKGQFSREKPDDVRRKPLISSPSASSGSCATRNARNRASTSPCPVMLLRDARSRESVAGRRPVAISVMLPVPSPPRPRPVARTCTGWMRWTGRLTDPSAWTTASGSRTSQTSDSTCSTPRHTPRPRPSS